MRIQKLQEEIDNHTENQKVVAKVNDVAEAVERMTGIPVSQMGASDIERLKRHEISLGSSCNRSR